jgi:hypothetical protein
MKNKSLRGIRKAAKWRRLANWRNSEQRCSGRTSREVLGRLGILRRYRCSKAILVDLKRPNLRLQAGARHTQLGSSAGKAYTRPLHSRRGAAVEEQARIVIGASAGA